MFLKMEWPTEFSRSLAPMTRWFWGGRIGVFVAMACLAESDLDILILYRCAFF